MPIPRSSTIPRQQQPLPPLDFGAAAVVANGIEVPQPGKMP